MSKLNKKKLVSIIFGSIIVAIILACAAVYYLGYAAVIFKHPGDRTIVVQDICDDRIDNYNSLIDKPNNTQLTKLINELADREESITDASCLFMITQGSSFLGDKDKAEEALHQLKDLQSKGLYASGKIKGLTDIGTLEKTQEFLKSTDEPLEVLGTG